MFAIFCGIDNVGKTTQIDLVRNKLAQMNEAVHVFHYSGFKLPKEQCIEYSKNLYAQMFNTMMSMHTSKNMSNIIYDRAHLGETVYGKIYRDYEADWVYDLEAAYMDFDFWNHIYLITFIDRPENVLKRDDGLSFSTDFDKKCLEIKRFKMAHKRSNIKHKLLINIDGLSIGAVNLRVNNFLFGEKEDK